MAEWFYKATNTKLDAGGTAMLANRGFLCRSAYTGSETFVANVRRVQFGDTIHFFFITRQRAHPIGAFEVVTKQAFQPGKHSPAMGDIGAVVPDTALYEIENPAFIEDLDDKTSPAYQPDPVRKKFTGWLIRRLGAARAPSPDFLANQATLVAADE